MDLKSYLRENVLPLELINIAYKNIMDEIKLETMDHRGGAVPRLVNMQATIKDGFVPIYRHPIDGQLDTVSWTPTVLLIKEHLEKTLNLVFNHVVIQYYKNGHCYIGEHSDKTLDIRRGTPIVNLSLGATRTFILKDKNTKIKNRIKLFNNSVYILTEQLNREYLHSIKQDKRSDNQKENDELGSRISLTFRQIDTYLKDTVLSGQGAVKEERSLEDQRKELLYAFRNENRQNDFDWEENYKNGFVILDCSTR
jgi:alkylated DNA repair dioxygenase AlkB